MVMDHQRQLNGSSASVKEGVPSVVLTQQPWQLSFSGNITPPLATLFRQKWEQHKELR